MRVVQRALKHQKDTGLSMGASALSHVDMLLSVRTQDNSCSPELSAKTSPAFDMESETCATEEPKFALNVLTGPHKF